MPRFRYDITERAAELEGLTAEQVGMWYLLVVVAWHRGPLPWAEVLTLERDRLHQDVKRTLSAFLGSRSESERFLLEEVGPDRWSFGWLEAHRKEQEEKSAKAKASGKAGGRGNTPRRKAARAKANAFRLGSTDAESERFPGAEKRTLSEPVEKAEKRTLSDEVKEPKSERFPEADKGARVHGGAQLSPVLFNEGELVEEKREKRAMLFRNSEHTEESWLQAFAPEVAAGVDVLHYFQAVHDWSEMNEKVKRSNRGWLATGRKWMRTDMGQHKLKMIRGPEQLAAEKDNAIDYLTLGK